MSSLAAGQGSDIIQLAAVSGGHSFNLYVIPQCSLQPNAAKVTGSGLHRGQLYLQHQLIPTNKRSFITFPQMIHQPLVSHNVCHLDGPLLVLVPGKLDLRVQFESTVLTLWLWLGKCSGAATWRTFGRRLWPKSCWAWTTEPMMHCKICTPYRPSLAHLSTQQRWSADILWVLLKLERLPIVK